MNPDQRIEAALRRRPSDERDYDEPLRSGGPERRGRVVPALLAACLTVVLVAATGVLVVWRPFNSDIQLAVRTAPPSGVEVGCSGRAPAFDPAILSPAGQGAELADTPAARALRLLLASPDARDLPGAGYYVVYSSPDEVMFVGLGTSIVEVDVRRGTQGQWSVDGWSVAGYGGCPLQVIPPAGYEPAAWELDPEAQLTPGSTQVSLLVLGQGCRSGVAASPDEIRAEVTYADRAVTVTASVVQATGFQTCQSVPPTRYVVKLDGPLGDRALFDGGQWPAVQRAVAGQPIVSPSPSPIPATPYTVKAGDTEASIAAAFHYQAEELELANPGVDMPKLEPGQTIRLPIGHWPTDCGASGDQAEPAGFFKVVAMSATYDVYCPVLPAGWTFGGSNEAAFDGTPTLAGAEINYQGPNGETLTLCQGLCSSGAPTKPVWPILGTARLADRDATLVGYQGSFQLETASDNGATWGLAATGIPKEQFLSIAGSMILVGK